ncbi:MAG TPA: adenylate/guanylate cyclase domain-containing protein [Planctomycetota bacterium]|nr:adenylate/guanylate cyclase domain-containing protein [Planctomycetota bacterium]
MARSNKKSSSPHPAPNDTLELLRSWQWSDTLASCESRAGAPDAELILGWNALENGDLRGARARLEIAAGDAHFAAWAHAGIAAAAMRMKEFEKAHKLLDALNSKELEKDPLLAALVSHTRGGAMYHEGADEKSLRELERALELCPPKHVLRGRILDSLGKYFASLSNFSAAREFFSESLKRKERAGDIMGLAFAHGSLGRLMLDWGYLKDAREHFLKDLELIRGKDNLGEATMYNFLGRIDLADGRLDDAAGWLDESAVRAAQAKATWIEGFARKDRALVHLARGELTQAEEQLDRAAKLIEFAEGQAHVNRARALLRRAQGRFAESEELLRKALAHFEESGENPESAQTLLEEARTLRARGAPAAVLRHAFERALDRAELCRRTRLVRDAEAEMRAADLQQFVLHAYRRVTGRNIDEDDVSMFEGSPQTVSVLFMDLKNSTEFVVCHDPRWVLMTLNQIFADLDAELRRHDACVNQYLGDGFMAYFRGEDHARRAVSAALAMTHVIESVNRPRKLLNLPPFRARLGIGSGEVVLGHVGTFRKFDFTAVGAATNLAARLQSEADPSSPCISRATYERVARLFTFKNANGRSVELKGFGEQRVWDVIGTVGTQILVNPGKWKK